MKILHISSPKSWRGGEQQLMYLVEELKKLGVKQVVMCPFNSEVHKYCLKRHLNHVTYFKGFTANPMVAFKVRYVCDKEGVDLVHVHDSHAHNFAVLSAVLTNNKLPIVVSRRVDFPITGNAMSMYKYNHDQVRKIICVSHAIKSVMAPFIEDKSKLCVVHSGIDIEKFDHAPSDILRKEYNIPADEVLIGNVAALAPHKDYPTFVKTAQILISLGIKAKFLGIGEGPSRKEAENAIAEANMENHIILTGFRTDIPKVLPELDLFLTTSKTEGLGTSVLDALAANVPVVATAAGGIPEIIQDKVNGRLAPIQNPQALAEAVIQTINSQEKINLYKRAGQETLKEFSKEITAKRTLKIYEELLDSSRGESDGSA